MQKNPIKGVYRLSIQRNIAYKGQKYSLTIKSIYWFFYKQRGTYFEVQSICCTVAFYMTIEYKYNQVCNVCTAKAMWCITLTLAKISPYLRKCNLTVGYNIQKKTTTQFTKAAAMVVDIIVKSSGPKFLKKS